MWNGCCCNLPVSTQSDSKKPLPHCTATPSASCYTLPYRSPTITSLVQSRLVIAAASFLFPSYRALQSVPVPVPVLLPVPDFCVRHCACSLTHDPTRLVTTTIIPYCAVLCCASCSGLLFPSNCTHLQRNTRASNTTSRQSRRPRLAPTRLLKTAPRGTAHHNTPRLPRSVSSCAAPRETLCRRLTRHQASRAPTGSRQTPRATTIPTERRPILPSAAHLWLQLTCRNRTYKGGAEGHPSSS